MAVEVGSVSRLSKDRLESSKQRSILSKAAPVEIAGCQDHTFSTSPDEALNDSAEKLISYPVVIAHGPYLIILPFRCEYKGVA
jgi:hypothetical protein